jgi:predicted GIY-YIG superfamily endonuclease
MLGFQNIQQQNIIATRKKKATRKPIVRFFAISPIDPDTYSNRDKYKHTTTNKYLPAPQPQALRRRLLSSCPLPSFSPYQKPIPAAVPKLPRPTTSTFSVYILELEDGRIYVGKSRNVEQRIKRHMAGRGAAYTKTYRPTGVLLPRLGNVVCNDGDAAERDETLRYMMARGIPYVRGWKFAQVVMTSAEFDEAEANIREMFDLCRRCGYSGHFMDKCMATRDRLGRECVCGGKKNNKQ